ncbi:hypothetical protein AAG906_004074 [Vitis piasezkii]
MKLKVNDEVQALLLLSSLPDSWETLVVSLTNSTPNGVITINMKEDKSIAVVASDGDTIIVCDDACVVDTTASFHIIARRDFFSSYTSGSFGWVRMVNEAKCEIVGMGDVELETSIGCKLVIKDVRYVPKMRFNLISVGKLDDEGYHSHLGEGKWKLTKGSLVLARGKTNNTLYKTEVRLVKGEVNIVENEASTKL